MEQIWTNEEKEAQVSGEVKNYSRRTESTRSNSGNIIPGKNDYKNYLKKIEEKQGSFFRTPKTEPRVQQKRSAQQLNKANIMNNYEESQCKPYSLSPITDQPNYSRYNCLTYIYIYIYI